MLRADTIDEREIVLGQFVDRLTQFRYASLTVRDYRLAAQRLFRTFPTTPLEAFTPEHLEHHLFGRHLSPASYRSELEQLRAFFKYLLRHHRLIKVNPAAGVEKPRVPERIRPAPSFAEFQALRRACRTLEEAVLVELLYFTGLRLNELRHIRRRDLDLERRRVRVVGKGDKERVVVFPPQTARLCRIYCQRVGRTDPNGYLLRSPMHPTRPRGMKWVEGVLKRLGREIGLSYPLTAHLMRHGHVRLLKARGVPLETARILLGHRNIQTTSKLYGRMSEDEVQATYDRHLKDFS